MYTLKCDLLSMTITHSAGIAVHIHLPHTLRVVSNSRPTLEQTLFICSAALQCDSVYIHYCHKPYRYRYSLFTIAKCSH